MFRRRPRRPLFRPGRRGRRRPPLPAHIGRKLNEAQRLLQSGRLAEAAPLFDELASGAEERRMLDRAGDLYLQAARCHLGSENTDLADDRALKAMRLFMRVGRPGKVRRLMPLVTQALRRSGREEDAERLRQEVEGLIGPMPAGQPAPGERILTREELPARCDSCGAPVKPDEVNWLDRQTAECPYCGMPIKTALKKASGD